ncbi:NUDIX hydrolase [Porphyrobacter sp. GA68]|uniref:NUDIX hydrolase n=1 Tax=Porphyrobacter sp. GA68 TaxID=2883480 RepID=UPI001D17D876|nr:NUDIX domain-containing protein [Porphyrobacter sp. GA68]
MFRLIPRPLHRLLLRGADRARRVAFRILRPHLRSVSVIGTTPDERLLLVRLTYGARKWTFPGGGIRRGETPESAARRELREETGCEVDGLRLVCSFEEQVLGTSSTAWLYTGNLLSLPKADEREVAEARLFPRHSLPEPLSARTARRLELWRQDRGRERQS